MNLSEITESFYGVIPNGNGYKIDWCTHENGNIYRSPACAAKGVFYGVEDPLETQIEKANAASKGIYDVVLFKRMDKDEYSFEVDTIAVKATKRNKSKADPIPYQVAVLTTKKGIVKRAYAEYGDDGYNWVFMNTHDDISPDEISDVELTDNYVFSDSRQVALTEDNIQVSGDLEYIDEDKPYCSINFEWDMWFDVDAYFGVTTRKYDSVWVNFYTNWNPYDGITADIVISSGNGWLKLDWELTKDEKKLLLKKMNEEVMRVEKKSLFDIYISEQDKMV